MTLDKFLRWTTYVSLFAVLLTPFIVTESLFFPFITGKNIFFRICVEIGFVAWALLALRDSSARPRRSALLWSFAAFAVVIGAANAFGENPWKSFWSNFERMEGYISILHLCAYFLVASSMLAKDKIWSLFLEVSVWVSGAISLYGVFQLFGWGRVPQGGARIDSLLGNATYLAVYALFGIFFAILAAVRAPLMWKKWAYGIITVLNLVALYNTGTRGSVIGLAAGLVVIACLIAFFDRKETKKRIVAWSVLGAIALVVVGFVAVRNTSFVRESPVLSRFASISAAELKTQGRYFIWPMAIEGFKDRPILGWGQENFSYVFNEHYDPRLYGQEQWFDRAHNAAIDWLVAGGILGLAAYLSLFISAAYLVWKKSPDMPFIEKSILTGLGVAYFANNMFVFDNVMSYIMFVVLLSYVHFRSTKLSLPVFDGIKEASVPAFRIAAGVLVIGLAFSLYFFNWRAYATASSLIDAMRYSVVDPIQPDKAVEAFEKTLSYGGVGRAEVIERMAEAAQTINSAEVPIAVRQKFFEMGSEAIETNLARFPGDARAELFAGSFYETFGLPGPAREHIFKAHELSPRKQTILYALGSFYLSNGQGGDAVESFKLAYELEPSNRAAAEYYAAALAAMGLESQARAFLLEKFGSDDMTGDAFLRSYIVSKDWARVASLLESRLKKNPGDLEIMRNLAAAYAQAGDKTSAIKVVRQMITIDPSLASTGEDFIRQIQAAPVQ